MKAHARVIWACSWAPGNRSFATGARDSLVKVWALGSGPDGMGSFQGLHMESPGQRNHAAHSKNLQLGRTLWCCLSFGA